MVSLGTLVVSKSYEIDIDAFCSFSGILMSIDSSKKFHCGEQHLRDLGKIGWLYVDYHHKAIEMMHHVDAQVSSNLQLSMGQWLRSHVLL